MRRCRRCGAEPVTTVTLIPASSVANRAACGLAAEDVIRMAFVTCRCGFIDRHWTRCGELN